MEPIFFLVGNKIDCTSSDVEIKVATALNVAKRLGVPKEQVFRMSIKTGEGMDRFLDNVGSILAETMKPIVKQDNLILHRLEDDRSKCPC